MMDRAAQRAEARRERALRRPCYPRGAKAGTLDATYQLKAMEAIVATLQRLDAKARQLGLFSDNTGTGRGEL